jgi:ParB family transcriptional regulator, chromosome partitioning protein
VVREKKEHVMQLLYIDPTTIERDPEGVRENDGDLSGLVATIREQGLLQPIGVVQIIHGRYRVVYGGRRLGAALEIGLDRLPCIVLDPDDPDLFLRQLIENVQRRDLNDLEKAKGFMRLREQLLARHDQLPEGELDERIGKAAGIAARTVRRYLGLLDLPEAVQQMIRDDELSVTQAQHLRRISSERTQIELARMAADEGLSAAEISRLANYFAANPSLTVDTALSALQAGADLRTEMSPASASDLGAAPGSPSTTAPLEDDADADLWESEAESDDQDAPSGMREDGPSQKARVFRIKSLDQMVDETDRLSRAIHEGDLQKWVRSDDSAPFKVSLLLKQLRTLARAIEQLASEQGWMTQE